MDKKDFWALLKRKGSRRKVIPKVKPEEKPKKGTRAFIIRFCT
jgi:hypothetical protein